MNTQVNQTLNQLLADHQVFYQKCRGYHWNVRGHDFFELHEHFEKLYDLAADHVDGIAERLRARGQQPVSTMKDILALARLKEDGAVSGGEQMVKNLVQDMMQLKGWMDEAMILAAEAKDGTTQRLFEDYVDALEKTRWMFDAFLGK